MSKQEVLQAINALPDDVSIKDIMYQLYLMNSVQEGLSDIKNGRTFTQQEVEAMFQN